jgi:hypothetical protein
MARYVTMVCSFSCIAMSVWCGGSCNEEACGLLSTVINLKLLPFQRHVEVLASEREKMDCGNNANQGKGNIKPQ